MSHARIALGVLVLIVTVVVLTYAHNHPQNYHSACITKQCPTAAFVE